uniref:RRM domain-containing protein n=1 Tax=Leersia perrieri TaxID=77586 RepID=A0A0D9W608_9ORYZ
MDDAGGSKPAADDAAFPPSEAIAAVQDTHAPSPTTTDDDFDDLYGDVNIFLPLAPLSLSPKSPPKTPSPGRSAPSPRRSPLPEPQPEQEPQPPKPTPPLPAPKPTPPRPPRSPPTTAVFIGELQYWTTDAQLEEALAPHGALRGLHFYTDKHSGKSLGYCRADFLRPDALDGRDFNGRSCVASLSCLPALLRLTGEDRDPYAVHDTPSGATRGRGGRGRGGHGSNSTAAGNAGWGNVGNPLGDHPAVSPLPRPVSSRLPQLPFGGMMGGGAVAGYGGGFVPMGQYNAGVATGMMPAAIAPHMNPAFMAAGGMAPMGGQGVWYNQQMGGNMWGGGQQEPWNFGGHAMPPRQQKQQQKLPAPQQFNRNEDHGKVRGAGRRERPPGGRNDQEGDIGNERGYQDRRQYGRDGFDQSRKHDRDERERYRPRVLEERDQWDERDRYGGDRWRYQEYPDRVLDRRGRTRSRSPSRDGDEDDHLRRRR